MKKSKNLLISMVFVGITNCAIAPVIHPTVGTPPPGMGVVPIAPHPIVAQSKPMVSNPQNITPQASSVMPLKPEVVPINQPQQPLASVTVSNNPTIVTPVAQPITTQANQINVQAVPVVQPMISVPGPVVQQSIIAQPITMVQPTASVQNNFQQPVMVQPASSKTSIVVGEEHKDKSENTVNSSNTNNASDVIHDIHDSQLDTVGLMTSGNWLLKRAWWEKTEDVYEQLKDVISKIMEMRAHFLSQKNEIDRTFDVCFSEVGLEQGELYDIVGYGKDLLDKEKAQGLGSLEEKDFAAKLAGRERDLEQLKLDAKGIDDIDKKINDALDVFFGQIDTCNKYEHKAWENFKDIARELDDKEARKLYYNTEALLKDIKNIEQYLEHDFSNYFSTMVQASKDHTQKISAQVNTLKNAGIDLKKELKILEQKNIAVINAQDAKKIAAEEKKKAEEAEKKRLEAIEKAKWYYPIKSTYVSIKEKCVHVVERTKSLSASLVPYMAKIQKPFNYIITSVAGVYDHITSVILKFFNKDKKEVTKVKKEKDSKQDVKKEVMPVEKHIVKKEVIEKKDAFQPKESVIHEEKVIEEKTIVSNYKKSDTKKNDLVGYYDKPIEQEASNKDAQYYDLNA